MAFLENLNLGETEFLGFLEFLSFWVFWSSRAFRFGATEFFGFLENPKIALSMEAVESVRVVSRIGWRVCCVVLEIWIWGLVEIWVWGLVLCSGDWLRGRTKNKTFRKNTERNLKKKKKKKKRHSINLFCFNVFIKLMFIYLFILKFLTWILF